LSSAVYPEQVYDEESIKAQQDRLKKTQYIQPSIGAVSAGLFKMMEQTGFKADMVAGHSYGELTALWAAGIIDDDNFYGLSRARAVAMGTSPEEGYDAGAMLAVMADAKVVEEKIKAFENVSMANYNSPKQVVVAGPTQTIIEAKEALDKDGLSVVQLPVTAAFHSPLVGYADKPFSKAIDKAKFNKPHTTIFSNVTAQAYPKSADKIKQSFKSNMLNSVQFTQQINAMAEQGGTIFVEFGPKNVLTRLVGSILGDKPHMAIALNSTPKKNSDTIYRDALVQLKVAGVELNLKDIYQADIEPPVVKKAGMNIKLNGANYVSDATKKAFEDTLNDDYQLTLPAKETSVDKQESSSTEIASAAQEIKQLQEKILEQEKIIAEVSQQAKVTQNTNTPPQNVQVSQPFNQSEWLVAQTATMKAHESYLNNQQDYSHEFFGMMHHLVDEYGTKNKLVPDNITHGMSELHQYQQDTLRVHESYLQGQIEFNKSTNQLISGQSANAYQVTEDTQVQSEAVTSSEPLITQSAPPVSTAPKTTSNVSTAVAKEVIKQEIAAPTPEPIKPAITAQEPVLDSLKNPNRYVRNCSR